MLSNEFSFKEMRTLRQSKISSCCLCLWFKSRELGGSGSPWFPTAMVESFSADLLPGIKSYWPETHLELYTASDKSRSVREHLTSLLFWISCLTITHMHLACLDELVLGVPWKVIGESCIGILSNISHGAPLRKLLYCPGKRTSVSSARVPRLNRNATKDSWSTYFTIFCCHYQIEDCYHIHPLSRASVDMFQK